MALSGPSPLMFQSHVLGLLLYGPNVPKLGLTGALPLHSVFSSVILSVLSEPKKTEKVKENLNGSQTLVFWATCVCLVARMIRN